MRKLFFIFIVLLLASCIPYSEKPLSDIGKEPLDSAIIGTWFWNENDEHGFIHFGKNEDGKTLLVTMVEYKNDKIETSEFIAHTTQIGADRFLNLRWTKPQKMDRGYLIVKYAVKGDTFTCSIPDLALLEKALKSGALKGKSLDSGDILIQAGQKELGTYLTKNSAAVFPHPSSLKKLTLPPAETKPDSAGKP